MPRPKKEAQAVVKNISFEPHLFAQVELLLYSEVEGKVPYGRWSEFINDMLREKLRAIDNQQSKEN